MGRGDHGRRRGPAPPEGRLTEQRATAPDPATAGPAPSPSPDALFTEIDARKLGPVRRWFLLRPRAMDRLVAAIYLVPAVVGALLEDTAPDVVLVPGAVVGAAVLLWRRRAPIRAAAAIGALAVVFEASAGTLNGLDLAVAFVVYAVAASSRPRTAWLTAGTLFVTSSVAVLLWERQVTISTTPTLTVSTGGTGTLGDRIGTVTGILLLTLVAIAIGTSVRNRRLHVASLVDRANALAIEREQGAQLAAAAERARIAREMHDVVAHSLSVMIALADGAGAALDRSPERAREALDELSGTGRAALADMRRVLGALRDPGPGADPAAGAAAPLDPQPGTADLDRLVDGLRTAGVPVRWTRSGPPLPPDTGVQLAVYRIVQESLTNVLRHAPGTARADVVVASGPGRVEVTVTDTGPARDGSPGPRGTGPGAGQATVTGTVGSGRGLIGMRERAAVYGGQVVAGPHDGGWRVHAVLTWDGGGP